MSRGCRSARCAPRSSRRSRATATAPRPGRACVHRGQTQLALQPLGSKRMRSRSLASRLTAARPAVAAWLHGKRARQRQPFAAGRRKAWSLPSGRIRPAHRLEDAHHLFFDLVPAQLRLPNAVERRILEHRHVRPDGVGLEHHAKLRLFGPRRCSSSTSRPSAAHRDLSGSGLLQAGDGAQRGRLAAATGPSRVNNLPRAPRR